MNELDPPDRDNLDQQNFLTTDNGATDKFGLRANNGIVLSTEDMTFSEVQIELSEGIGNIPPISHFHLRVAALAGQIESNLCQPLYPDNTLRERQAGVEATVRESIELLANSEHSRTGGLRTLTDGAYRSLELICAFSRLYMARIERRPLRDVEYDEIYFLGALLTGKALRQIDQLDFSLEATEESRGTSLQGKVSLVWGALSELIAFQDGVRPNGGVLFSPTPFCYRTNDAGVLFQDINGRQRELAADFKFARPASSGANSPRSSQIYVGTIARKAVHPFPEELRGTERLNAAWEAVVNVATIMFDEYRGRALTRSDKQILNRFSAGMQQRVANMGKFRGEPELLEKVRY